MELNRVDAQHSPWASLFPEKLHLLQGHPAEPGYQLKRSTLPQHCIFIRCGDRRRSCTVSMHKGRSKRDFSKQTLEQCGTAWDEIQMRGIVKQSRSRLLGS